MLEAPRVTASLDLFLLLVLICCSGISPFCCFLLRERLLAKTKTAINIINNRRAPAAGAPIIRILLKKPEFDFSSAENDKKLQVDELVLAGFSALVVLRITGAFGDSQALSWTLIRGTRRLFSVKYLFEEANIA